MGSLRRVGDGPHASWTTTPSASSPQVVYLPLQQLRISSTGMAKPPTILIPVGQTSSFQFRRGDGDSNGTLTRVPSIVQFHSSSSSAGPSTPTGDVSQDVRSARERLKRKIEQRPSRQRLVTQHILLSSTSVAPLIAQTVQRLKKDRIVSRLNQRLQRRPGPLELINKKILQVDAELEQAVQEGRLTFKPTGTPVDSVDADNHNPISVDMEVISPACQMITPTATTMPASPMMKARARKKSTTYRTISPYEPQSQPSSGQQQAPSFPLRTKAKPQIKEHAHEEKIRAEPVLTRIPEDQSMDEKEKDSMTNYELLLQQQQLFLEWQMEVDSQKPTPPSTDSHSTRSVSVPAISAPTATAVAVPTSSSSSSLNGRCAQCCLESEERPKTKLSDFRVQDLKNECKKRSLPVSGAKPQLLERLKPYEAEILAPASPQVECAPSPSSLSPPPTVAMRSDPIQDYLQQQQPPPPQNVQVVVQLPPQVVSQAQNQPRIAQLIDANGTVVGMATVQCCCVSGSRDSSRGCQTHVVSQPATTQAVLHVPSTAMFPKTISSVPTSSVTTINGGEPTFRFAQLGSGGQFTLVTSNEPPPPPPCDNVTQMHSKSSNSMNVRVEPSVTYEEPPRTTYRIEPARNDEEHPHLVRSQSIGGGHEHTSSPIHGDQAGSSPNMPTSQSVASLNGVQKAETGSSIASLQIDPNDPNSLLSATTLSIHEEMLRFQQKKIEELQKELTRSQQQLRHQQQVILAAKKAQQARREPVEGAKQTAAEAWLNQLDIKHLNKFHIQLFLQHKLQQQQLQSQIAEQQSLVQTEEKMQEELHVEQAVQDIVRLIKQDARTALLIVQLLRRYQLERNQRLQAEADAAQEESRQRARAAAVVQHQSHQPQPQPHNHQQSPRVVEVVTSPRVEHQHPQPPVVVLLGDDKDEETVQQPASEQPPPPPPRTKSHKKKSRPQLSKKRKQQRKPHKLKESLTRRWIWKRSSRRC